jgi:hypothetical protein
MPIKVSEIRGLTQGCVLTASVPFDHRVDQARVTRLLAECKLESLGGIRFGDPTILLRSASHKGYLDYGRFTQVAK